MNLILKRNQYCMSEVDYLNRFPNGKKSVPPDLFCLLFVKVTKFPLFPFPLLRFLLTIHPLFRRCFFFVSDAIKELLHNRCVEPLKFVPEIVNPLSVSVQSSGKKRLILDLRHINMYVFQTEI